MSHVANTNFFERVSEFLDEHEGMSHINAKVEKLIDEERFEEAGAYMNEVDAELSREHFYNYNMLGDTDVY